MSLALAIERLAVGCHVPKSVADDTRRAKDILDRVLSSATRELPECLRRALASEPATDTIAFIDTLHFDVTINAEWPRDEIARALAVQLVRGLWRKLDDPHTIRFKDRAEMLGRFFLDLAQGAAFTRSWHDCFAGLRLLPMSGIARTLIVNEPVLAGAALARLLPADLQKMTALLNELDAERALAAILGAAQGCGEADPVAVATAIVSQDCLPLQNPQQQLSFAIAMLRETGTIANTEMLSLARTLVQLASKPDGAMAAKTDATSVAEAVRILSEEFPDDEAAERSSSCGGIWLVLPHVLAVLGHEMELAPVALCALALAAGDDAEDVWRDDLLRAMLDVDDAALSRFQERTGSGSTFPAERSSGEDAREETTESRSPPSYSLRRRNLAHLRRGVMQLNLPGVLTRAATRVAYAALSAYARRLPGFAESSFAHLWKNFLATPAMLRVRPSAIEVMLAPPPLDVIWRISGADRAAYVLPNGRSIRVELRR
jgi:hypothetical protein